MLKDLINNGPYQLKPEITIKDTDGVTDICRPQSVEDLVGQEKLRYDSDIKGVNILLLGFPVDIYILINHYQTAKEIWDHLYAFLKHNEKDAKEVREMRQRFPEPLDLLANTYNLPPSYSSCYAPTVVQQPPIFQPDTGFVAPTFLPTDDLIASLNKAMIFLSSAYSLIYPPTNNQLRTSSNPRTQATIQNGQIMVQNVQGRQSQGYAGNVRNNQASGARVVNLVRNEGGNQPRVIRCYNCNGEGHIAKQCAAKKRVKDSEWSKDKMLLAQAQEARLQATINFKADYVDAYDSDYDDEATKNAIFMASLSPVGYVNDDMVEPRYDSDILSEVPHYDTYHDSDMLNYNIQELGYIENIVSNNESYDELTSNNNVISYTDYMLTIRNDDDNYVPPLVQKNDMMLSVIEQMKSQVEKRVCSTNASGSNPKSNIKSDRIPQPSSKIKKNKLEAHHRKFKSSANKNNHVLDCNANVKNVALSKNSYTSCLSCNECLFSTNHDACVVQYLKKMQKT
ncbi:retrovirus-related pol polyprotein from transposon TNT 1-94 [Tanacetum coccineum]